jgi:hypothetical protein
MVTSYASPPSPFRLPLAVHQEANIMGIVDTIRNHLVFQVVVVVGVSSSITGLPNMCRGPSFSQWPFHFSTTLWHGGK